MKLDDLGSDLLPKLKTMSVNNAMGSHPWKDMDDELLLKSAGLYGIDRATGEQGYNLAAVMLLGRDDVMLSRFHRLEECVHRLKRYPVLLVRVDCPMEELRRRERERGDGQIGQAESQLSELEPRETYDVNVNTAEEKTEVC